MRSLPSCPWRPCRLALLLSVFALSLQAQNYAEVTGTVGDPSGAVIVGAEVTLTNNATGQVRAVTTNESGNFIAPFLVPGVYEVRVSSPGFRSASRAGLELQIGDVARVDFRLELGQVAEVVEVSGGAPLLSTENTVVGTVIENKRIVELPLNGRNYLQMIALTEWRLAGERNPFVRNQFGFTLGGPIRCSSASRRSTHPTTRTGMRRRRTRWRRPHSAESSRRARCGSCNWG